MTIRKIIPSNQVRFFCEILQKSNHPIVEITDESETRSFFICRSRQHVETTLRPTVLAHQSSSNNGLGEHPPLNNPTSEQASLNNSTAGFNNGIHNSDLEKVGPTTTAPETPDQVGQVGLAGNRNKRKFQERQETDRVLNGAVKARRISQHFSRSSKVSKEYVRDEDDSDLSKDEESLARQVVMDPGSTTMDEWILSQVSAKDALRRNLQQRTKMIEMAKNIGGNAIIEEWTRILCKWRGQNPLSVETLSNSTESWPCSPRGVQSRELVTRNSQGQGHLKPPFLQSRRPEVQIFLMALGKVQAAQISDTLTTISLRINLAALWTSYLKAEDAIAPYQWEIVGCNRRSEAKKQLFLAINPAYDDGSDLTKSNFKNSVAWSQFEQLLKRASRWYKIKEQLGQGIMALLSKDMSNTFIEQQLTTRDLQIWLDLIVNFNQEAITAGSVLQPLLIRVLSGRPAPKEKIKLEDPFLRYSLSLAELFKPIDEMILSVDVSEQASAVKDGIQPNKSSYLANVAAPRL